MRAPLTSFSSLKSASVLLNATGEPLIVIAWSVIMSPALIACEVATSVRVEVFCTLMLSLIKRTLPPTNRYAGAFMSSIGYCFIYCLCWF